MIEKIYSNEELIKIIQDFYKQNNRVPTMDDFRHGVKPNASTFTNRFGSWKNTLKVAGLKKDKFKITGYTDKELIDLLIKYYNEYNKVPTTRDFKANKDYPNPETYRARFGNWKEALIKADLYDLRTDKKLFDRKTYSKEELLELLNNYIIKNNELPTTKEWDENNYSPHSSCYNNYFNGFDNAIKELGYDPSIKKQKVTNEAIINSLKRLYKELGRIPTSRDINKCSYCPYTKVYTQRFGNLYKALDMAGIYNIPKSTYFTNDEIIDMWYDLKNKIKRTPRTKDMENYKLNLYSAIIIKWNSYSEFLHKIGEDANYNKYGCKIYFTTNGTKCFSWYELIITQWLEDNNIIFNKETCYRDIIPNDNTDRRFDWVINYNNKIYYVEMFGICNDDDYDKKTKCKIKDCKDNNINLIELYPYDLKKPLEEVFSFLFED